MGLGSGLAGEHGRWQWTMGLPAGVFMKL